MKRSRETLAITEAAAIAALIASPPTTGRCSNPVGGTGKPSDRHRQPSRPTRRSTSHSAARLVLCRPALVDPAHAARGDGHAGGDPQHARVELLAHLGGVLLGVVQRGQRAQVRQRQSARSRTAPPRRPAGRPGSRARPRRRRRRSGRPSLRSNRNKPTARRALALPRLEEPDPLGRPVGGEGFADDPFLGDGSPEPAVVGRATVVAHHEVVTGGNWSPRRGSCSPRRRRRAPRTTPAGACR